MHDAVRCIIRAFRSCSRQVKFYVFLRLMLINHTDFMLIISRFKTAFLNFFDRRHQTEISRAVL
jgi:hypothetical protein